VTKLAVSVLHDHNLGRSINLDLLLDEFGDFAVMKDWDAPL
jgi:hypothetical protein